MRSAATMALVSLAILSSSVGCQLIAGVDRELIPEQGSGGAGGAGQSSSSSSGQGGSAGEAGMGGIGGTGGIGGMGGTGGAECSVDFDCPTTDCAAPKCDAGLCTSILVPAGTTCNEGSGTVCDGNGVCVECQTAMDCPAATTCQVAECNAGKCETANVAGGTQISNMTLGDCSSEQCDGMGTVTNTTDDLDLPTSNQECKIGSCSMGAPSITNAPVGTTCGANNTSCDANGNCVGCLVDADCGAPTECNTPTCTSGTCGDNFKADGTALVMQTAGDCKVAQCNGTGGVKQAIDDNDLPMDDGNDCTNNVCNASMPEFPNSSVGTSCTDNGGTVCNNMGMCVECNLGADCVSGVCSNSVCQAPEVLSIAPTTPAAVGSSIAITFSGTMDPTTLVAQQQIGPCSGSVQFSVDNFATCYGFASASPTMGANNKTATFVPAPGLSFGTTYKVNVTTGVTDISGKALAPYQPMDITTVVPQSTCTGSVVISQIYGSGGAAGAAYMHDFVELHNRGNTPMDLTGWSVQYAVATLTNWQVTTLAGILDPGDYYLVRLGSAGNNGMAVPTPDASGGTSLASDAGKVALVANSTALVGGCPSGAVVRDFIGYGPTASCAEGNMPAAPHSVTESIHRKGNGCTDTTVNLTDTELLAAAPRNTQSTALQCDCPIAGALGTANESNTTVEMDYCNVQFPLDIMVTAGMMTPVIYGRVYEVGFTEAMGANPAITVEVGFGPANVNPSTQSGYQFFPATYNVQNGNDDEYMASFSAPVLPGDYRYVYRFTRDGSSYTYCDKNGSGSNGGLSLEIHELPVLTVMP